MPAPLTPVEHAAAHRRRLVVGAVKLLVAASILAYLLVRLSRESVFQRLVEEPKHWGFLAAAQALVLAAIMLNFTRWFVLGRALGLTFSLGDAFRLSALGFLLNQVSPGSVGGDLFKAVFVAGEQPGKRTEAVASVLIDRVVGLYAMLLVATFGYLFNPARAEFSATMHMFARSIVAFAAIGTAGLALLMTPVFSNPAMREALGRWPVVGATLVRLVDAAAAYRHHAGSLFAGVLLGCCTHTLFVLAYWCIGRGLPITAPSLAENFVVVPMSLAAGAIPLTPSGLGVAEAAVGQLYKAVGCPDGDGYLAGMTNRVMTYVMAVIGALYYVNARRKVTEVLHEAETLADNERAALDEGAAV